MIGCLRTRVRKQPIIALYFEFETRVRKQPIIALYFEFETVLKFYNLGARPVALRAANLRLLCICDMYRNCTYMLHWNRSLSEPALEINHLRTVVVIFHCVALAKTGLVMGPLRPCPCIGPSVRNTFRVPSLCNL